MRINKQIHMYILLMVVTVFLSLLNGCSSSKTKLTEINNFSELFKDVYLMEIGEKEHSYSCIYQEDIDEIVELLMTLELYEEPVNTETAFERNKSYYIKMRKKDLGYAKIYIDDEMKTLWMDRGDTYTVSTDDEEDIVSYTYKIKNKKILEKVFEPLDAYHSEKVYKQKYLDVRVMEVNDDHLIVREERLNSDFYVLEDWYKELGDSYKIEMNTLKNEKNKFRNGDKLRIEFEEIKDNIITKIKNIYYINELLYLKDYGTAKYFEDEQIDMVMNAARNEFYGIHFSSHAIWYMQCDDERFAKVNATDEVFKENPNDIENTLMIFFRVLPSRGMLGEEKERDAYKYSEFGMGGWQTTSRAEVEKLLNSSK